MHTWLCLFQFKFWFALLRNFKTLFMLICCDCIEYFFQLYTSTTTSVNQSIQQQQKLGKKKWFVSG